MGKDDVYQQMLDITQNKTTQQVSVNLYCSLSTKQCSEWVIVLILPGANRRFNVLNHSHGKLSKLTMNKISKLKFLFFILLYWETFSWLVRPVKLGQFSPSYLLFLRSHRIHLKH